MQRACFVSSIQISVYHSVFCRTQRLPAGSPVGGSDSPPGCHSLPPTALRLPLCKGVVLRAANQNLSIAGGNRTIIYCQKSLIFDWGIVQRIVTISPKSDASTLLFTASIPPSACSADTSLYTREAFGAVRIGAININCTFSFPSVCRGSLRQSAPVSGRIPAGGCHFPPAAS